MKKNIMTISFLFGLLTLSLGVQNGAYALAVSPAYAESNAQSAIVSNNPGFHETICHYPIGNEIRAETIIVGQPAVLNAHLLHGDTYGECPLICPPGAVSCVSADGTPGIVWSYGTTVSSPHSQRDLKGS